MIIAKDGWHSSKGSTSYLYDWNFPWQKYRKSESQLKAYHGKTCSLGLEAGKIDRTDLK